MEGDITPSAEQCQQSSSDLTAAGHVAEDCSGRQPQGQEGGTTQSPDGTMGNRDGGSTKSHDQDSLQTDSTQSHEGGAGDEREEVEVPVPREHGRLDTLLGQIPKKAQHGLLMQCDLVLTCIDANQHYIALGTNIGLTFLYNRQDHSMQRLRSETSSEVVTCVKLHLGVDHQVAVGMASGALCIFFIPGLISIHKKQMQKFDVRSVHSHYISCVQWSTNGMKLFSGDKTGHVIVTEVDFYQGQCKSTVLLVESSTEIVQLHYDHRVLLVSTRHRSFLCRLDTTGHTVPIGEKDRKVQGNFGAVLIPGLCKVEDARLYAVRPGCRIWLSDIHGNVLHTYIFKDLLSAGHPDIPLLHPATRSTNPNAELQFGRLAMYADSLLLTFNTTTLFILDPRRNRVVGSQNQLGGIVDVAVHQDEVFVLRRHGDAAIIRIAHQPEVLINTGAAQDVPVTTTTTTTISATASSSISSAGPGEPPGVVEEENKAKQFFKKTFLSPFKKLDNFIQEHTQGKDAPEPDLRPVIRSDPDQTMPPEPTAPPSASHDYSPDLPPVVPLDSPDLVIQVFPGGRKESGTPVDVQSPDSADSALSVFAEEVVDRGVGSLPAKGVSEDRGVGSPPAKGVSEDRGVGSPPAKGVSEAKDVERKAGEGRVEVGEGASSSQNADSEDIIHSHRMHKKKVKKKKAKGGKAEKEADNVSQSSLSSQAGEERKRESGSDSHKEIDDVLRRAEEALSSVDRLLKAGGDQEKEGQEDSRGEEGEEGGHGVGGVGGGVTDSGVHEGKTANTGGEAPSMHPEVDRAGDTGQQDTRHAVPDTPKDSVDSGSGGWGEVQTAGGLPTASSASAPARGPSPAVSASVPGTTSPVSTSPSHSVTHRPGVDGQVADTDRVPHALSVASPTESVLDQSCSDGAPVTSYVPKEGEDPLEAAERTLDSMTRRYKLPVKQESTDDFYSKFSSPYSPTDILESPPFPPSQDPSLSSIESAQPSMEHQTSRNSVVSWGSERSVREGSVQRVANNWSEFTTPANIYSLALSSSHIWFTDKSENLYYSALGTAKGIVWRKVGEQAGQISVSPSGHIVWRLHRGRAFAGTKITQRRPEGLKWVEAVNNVSHISVDDRCAWYVKVSGELMMQRGLSKERPCFRSLPVETEVGVRQVMARYGVVWAISDAMTLLVRTGISNDVPQGLAWQSINREREPFLFSNVTVDNEGIGWAVDVVGQIWFTDHVTPQNPVGSGKWWQIPLSEYFVQDPSVLDMLRSMAKKLDTQRLAHILSTKRGGLIAAGDQGVWLALDYLNTLHVCRGSLQGYHWSPAQPSQMAESTTWKQVNAAVAHLSWGVVWAQQVNGELYAIPADSRDATLIPTPSMMVSYSVNEQNVWGLTLEGALYIRTGMGQHCPLGVDWASLELLQLGDIFLVHVSCNNNYVWIVDGDGRVFHRIGAAPPRAGQMNPVWLPIDVYTDIVFTKVLNGPLDWMVWAIDNRRLTYVRVGVGEDMPIGKEWVHVPGIQAMDLCVSASGVWALNTNGEILFRYGVAPDNVSGNYWKKIPGCFTRISASYDDLLWAVTTSGQLVKCSCRLLLRRQDSADPLLQRSTSTASEEGEWELV